jgi:hypothetical protein
MDGHLMQHPDRIKGKSIAKSGQAAPRIILQMECLADITKTRKWPSLAGIQHVVLFNHRDIVLLVVGAI